MVTLRPDWQERLAALHSAEAQVERAEERAAELRPSARGRGGRPARALAPALAAAVLVDLERWSLRYVAGKYAEHRLSVAWLHAAWRDGRLRRMAGL